MIIVRKAKSKDIDDIVNIHLNRFASFFLTSLGVSFLKNFYKAFLKEPAILLVIEDNNEIKGFAAGSKNNKGFFKKLLLNNFIGFCLVGTKILFTNPKALIRLGTNASKSEKNNTIFVELLSIAAEKNKKGYGKILLNEFEKIISLDYCNELPISLTTDFINNQKVVDFYLKSGYEVLEVFEGYQKRKMYRLIKQQTKKKINT